MRKYASYTRDSCNFPLKMQWYAALHVCVCVCIHRYTLELSQKHIKIICSQSAYHAFRSRSPAPYYSLNNIVCGTIKSLRTVYENCFWSIKNLCCGAKFAHHKFYLLRIRTASCSCLTQGHGYDLLLKCLSGCAVFITNLYCGMWMTNFSVTYSFQILSVLQVKYQHFMVQCFWYPQRINSLPWYCSQSSEICNQLLYVRVLPWLKI